MDIICIDPHTNQHWQKLVGHYQSSVFHSPAWIGVLAETYELDIQAQLAFDRAGEPIAGFPFCRIGDIKSERFVSLPFSDYCDPLVHNLAHWQNLVAPLLETHLPFTIRCLHNPWPLTDERFKLVNKAKWHGLDLQPDLEALWSNLDSTARRAIKKAEREGVTLHQAECKKELRTFFELHLGVRKNKYHLLAQPYHFFENIWTQFIEKQKGVLMVAVYRSEIIGAVIFLEWQDKLYYKFNASHPAYISFRPNDLIIWEGIKYGKAKGYTRLDFGLSDWDQEGLVHYKRKYASEEKTISFLRYYFEEKLTKQEKHVQSLLPQLTDLFTQAAVPDCITEKAGEVLYKFFT